MPPSASDPTAAAAASQRAPGRSVPLLPAACLASASVFLNLGLVLAFAAADDIELFFYQPRVLAVTHTFTLGWISLTIIGVLYRFIPALTKQPLRRPWLARVQVATFVFGALGLIAHFWIGHLNGMAWSAATLVGSVVLLVVLLLPPVLATPQHDATTLGLAIALPAFLGVALLGFLYALDKNVPFLGGNVLTNISGHAHLALLGWVSISICAVSYRMIAAFTLPTVLLGTAARRQVMALAGSAIPLVAAILCARAWVAPLALLTAAVLGWYMINVLRLLRTRRLPIDWSIRHVLAALLFLCLAIAAGLAFAFAVDPGSAVGTHLAVAYGIVALFGWVSNFILGMGTRLAPGVAAVGGGRPQPLLAERTRAFVFITFNIGVLGMTVGALAGRPGILRAGIVVTAAGTARFTSALLVRASRLFHRMLIAPTDLSRAGLLDKSGTGDRTS